MKRPYRFTRRAKLIAIAYGVGYMLLCVVLSVRCECALMPMFQAHGLFWMVYVLFGLFLLWCILRTAERE